MLKFAGDSHRQIANMNHYEPEGIERIMECRHCEDTNFMKCYCCRGRGRHPGQNGCTGLPYKDRRRSPGLSAMMEKCSSCDGSGKTRCEHPDLGTYYDTSTYDFEYDYSPGTEPDSVSMPGKDSVSMPGKGYSGYSDDGDQSGRPVRMEGHIRCVVCELTGDVKVTWDTGNSNPDSNSSKELVPGQCEISCPRCKAGASVYFFWPQS